MISSGKAQLLAQPISGVTIYAVGNIKGAYNLCLRFWNPTANVTTTLTAVCSYASDRPLVAGDVAEGGKQATWVNAPSGYNLFTANCINLARAYITFCTGNTTGSVPQPFVSDWLILSISQSGPGSVDMEVESFDQQGEAHGKQRNLQFIRLSP